MNTSDPRPDKPSKDPVKEKTFQDFNKNNPDPEEINEKELRPESEQKKGTGGPDKKKKADDPEEDCNKGDCGN